MTTSEWWVGLPALLKAFVLTTTLPAWLAIVYFIAAGEADSAKAFGAFAVFAVSAIPHFFIDRRSFGKQSDNGLSSFDGDG